jgi:hypothetical protein
MALVHSDLAERQAVGFSGSGQYRFVVFLTLLFGVGAYLLSRRLLLGPTLKRDSWAVYWEPGEIGVSLEALIAPLRRYGYDPTLSPLEGEGSVGADHGLLRQQGIKHGGVTIDLRGLSQLGCGLVEAIDTRGELYEELAKYVLYELGRLIPGLTFRGSWSSLTPESTETLAPQLPDRPLQLRG